MRIIITGAHGQLGYEFCRIATDHDVVALDHQACDITDMARVKQVIQDYQPELLINCAAYTAVDRAEEDKALCFAINRDGVGHLAQACEQQDCALIHFSTDYVFGGGDHPLKETDPVSPINTYAESKLAGEALVRAHCAKHLIVRVSWLNGIHGHNFMKTMLKLAQQNTSIQVVNDQNGCPTFADTLAQQIFACIEKLENHWGTYHYCQEPATTWFHFAKAIIQEAQAYQKFKVDSFHPITTAEYPTPAKRPQYSVLDTQKFQETFELKIPDWREDLKRVLWEYFQ